MSLVPIEVTVAGVANLRKGLYAKAGHELWVLHRGDPEREIDPQNVEATETLVPVYADPYGQQEVPQPVLSDGSGQWPYWHEPRDVDYYRPEATTPLASREAAPGAPWRGGGLRILDHDVDSPNPADLNIDPRGPGVEPGMPGPGGNRAAGRVGTLYTDIFGQRSTLQSALNVVENSDPAEWRLRRTPGPLKAHLTGTGEADRKRPVGYSTQVAAPADAEATEVFLVHARHFPSYYDGSVTDPIQVDFKVGGQAITYEPWTIHNIQFSGSVGVGDTEAKVAEAAQPLPDGPGILFSRTTHFRYEEKVVLLDGQCDALVKAGDTSMVVRNVSAVAEAELPAAGAIKVATGTGGLIRRWRYDSYTYNAGTEKATFTFAVNVVTRNVLEGATVRMHKLTGLTSDFTARTLFDIPAGVDTLPLDFVHPENGQSPDPALIDMIPESGTLRVETLDDDPDGPFNRDWPVERLAYTDFDGSTLTLASGLPREVPADSLVTIEGCVGMTRSRANGQRGHMHCLRSVSGLTSAVGVGEVAEFSPRYANPGPAVPLGFGAWDNWEGVRGYRAQSAVISGRALEPAIPLGERPGAVTITIGLPDVSIRDQRFEVSPAGVGIFGGGIDGIGDVKHRLHVADFGCRAQPPGIVLEPEDPDDDHSDDPPDPGGQRLDGTLHVNHTTDADPTGILRVPAYNRETGSSTVIELYYDDKTATTFEDLELVTPSEGFILSDFFVDGGARLRYAASHRSAGFASKTGIKWDEGRPTEGYLGVGVGENGEPGMEVAGSELIYRDASGHPAHDGRTLAPFGVQPQARIAPSANQDIPSGAYAALLLNEVGRISGMTLIPSLTLTGAVSKNGTTTLTGTGTQFLSELVVGDRISVPGGATEIRTVTAIASDTSLTVATAFAQTASGQTATRVSSRLRVERGGTYSVGGAVRFAVNATGERRARLAIVRAGSLEFLADILLPTITDQPSSVPVNDHRALQVGDELVLQALQRSGADLAVQTAGARQATYLYAHYLGAAP